MPRVTAWHRASAQTFFPEPVDGAAFPRSWAQRPSRTETKCLTAPLTERCLQLLHLFFFQNWVLLPKKEKVKGDLEPPQF